MKTVFEHKYKVGELVYHRKALLEGEIAPMKINHIHFFATETGRDFEYMVKYKTALENDEWFSRYPFLKRIRAKYTRGWFAAPKDEILNRKEADKLLENCFIKRRQLDVKQGRA